MKGLVNHWALSLIPVLALAGQGNAQELAREALRTFSSDTIRIEYASPSKLRGLPDYDSLKQRFVGPRLREMEESFAKLGVPERDINEVMLAWKPGSSMMELSGLVAGRFTARQIADGAASNGIAATPFGIDEAYCIGSGSGNSCLVILRDSVGIFGTEQSLRQMLDVRDGTATGLPSDSRLAKFLGEAAAQAPIWGVATGVAVPDLLRSWLPQGNIELDWSRAFQPVESMVYSVEAADTVRLDVKMDCTDDRSAESTRQIFEGLRMVQQMAWQNLHPGRPNPFQNLEIARDGSHLSLRMASSYTDLQGFSTLGG